MYRKRVQLIIFISLCSVFIFGFSWYVQPPEITTKNITLEYGEHLDINKSVMTKEEVVFKKMIKGKVDNQKLGKQKITVQVTNKRKISTEKQITVNVVDNTSPVIHVEDILTAEAQTDFDIMKQIKVKDNVDGDISKAVKVSDFKVDTVIEEKITITAQDSSNNKSEKVITLKVVDTTKPNITAKDKSITEGESIDLKKDVSAKDNLDGDLTDKIKVIGEVDKNKPGTYQITYKVKDKSNNEATASIQVKVNSKPVVVKQSYVTSESTSKSNTQSKVSSKTTSASKSSSSYAPMMIYFNGKAVSYANGGTASGQSIIDGGRKASTWGGAGVFSGTDGLNTHIIGHNPGNFTGIQNAGSFVVTDKNGKPFHYRTVRVFKVNDYGKGIKDGVDYWNMITGKGGGERVVFQTCYNDDINWIIEAKP